MNLALKILTGQEFGSQISLPDILPKLNTYELISLVTEYYPNPLVVQKWETYGLERCGVNDDVHLHSKLLNFYGLAMDHPELGIGLVVSTQLSKQTNIGSQTQRSKLQSRGYQEGIRAGQ